MKSVLISIQPKWCELIASGKKTIEVRKTRPKIDTPFKCYIYCTKKKPILGIYNFSKFTQLMECEDDDFDYYNRNTLFKANGKAIGEFVCDRIDAIESEQLPKDHESYEDRKAFYDSLAYTTFTRISYDELSKYVGYGLSTCYGWHISELKIYDKPKELSEFTILCKEYDKDNPDCECCDYQSATCDCDTPPQFDCKCNGFKPLTRPPQSWCYVEG